MGRQARADLMLLLVTLCWGISYYLVDVCLAELGPFTLISLRFLGAFAIAAIVSFPRLRGVSSQTLKYSLFTGMALVVTYFGATFGQMNTSLSNAGFICALTVVFTPLLAFVFKKQVPAKKMWVVLAMCLVGIALLTLDDSFRPALGDILCLLCAVAYAVDLLITETAVQKQAVNAFQMGVFQLGFTGILCLVPALLTEQPKLPSTGFVWFALVVLSIFCTGVAFIVQVVAQQYTSATHVGVIFALEPVFAGVAAFFLAGEVLRPRAYLGAAIMVLSLFVMELDLGTLFRRKKSG